MTDASTTVDAGPLAECTRNTQHYMSVTYFFAHYVRDLGCLPIEQAVPRITSIPAKHFQIDKRGILAEGYYADINVFALKDLKINATFQDTCRYSEGMRYVIVNGVPVIAQGEHTLKRPGYALRHGR
jgi:N-acyl-D-amino-acid deacylase